MNKITVIQLLNKIANNEEVPKKIKYNNDFYIHNKENDFTRENSSIYLFEDFFGCYLKDNLNQEVEIIVLIRMMLYIIIQIIKMKKTEKLMNSLIGIERKKNQIVKMMKMIFKKNFLM
jgi:hypothetical protein